MKSCMARHPRWSRPQLEAIRRFPTRVQDDGCGLITFVRGWITERPGKDPVLNIGARVTYCDRAEVAFIQAWARVPQEERDGF